MVAQGACSGVLRKDGANANTAAMQQRCKSFN